MKMYVHEKDNMRASLRGEVLLLSGPAMEGVINGSRVFLTSNKEGTLYRVESRFDTYLKTKSESRARKLYNEMIGR